VAADGLLLFGRSEVRHAILVRFFSQPGGVWHIRALARQLGHTPQAVGRELERLEQAGVLTSEMIGRARRYRIDEASPIAGEIRALVQKTIGVEAMLRRALAQVPGVEEAFIFGSYAREAEHSASDIDVMVIGRVDRVALSEHLVEIEQQLERYVSVVVYDRPEFERLHRSGNPFLADVFAGPRMPLLPEPKRAA
jgi:predicted nucleotidyltransferase